MKSVRIGKETIPVRAEVKTIFGYSGHKDSDGLINFVENMEDTLKKVFVVLGEPKSTFFLVQKIRDNLGIEASAPDSGSSVSIEF
jgi:metallo-beta-lactamase family protein